MRILVQHEAVARLTEKQAFEAMRLFLKQFYERAGNEMETLLADITVESDGGTLDPAAWDDWQRCVRSVEERLTP
jgi:hypothetical protein